MMLIQTELLRHGVHAIASAGPLTCSAGFGASHPARTRAGPSPPEAPP
ncbi:hypothetical protein [Vitiosangium sp. GDMCC 1.1324]|nr:hypothetical protein [Vitiosangium sp. GDMCC 1.1324]